MTDSVIAVVAAHKRHGKPYTCADCGDLMATKGYWRLTGHGDVLRWGRQLPLIGKAR